MLTFRNVSIAHGANTLVENVNFSVYKKQVIGLCGHNGCGKSSLLATITHNSEVQKGEVELKGGVSVQALEQEVHQSEIKAIDFVISGDAHLYKIYQDLADAEAINDYDLMMKCHQKLSECDGYSAQATASKMLKGLGFSDEAMLASYQSFSGGWRMRLNLAKCLFTASDLLLLDEPTNHLDMEAIIWLENFLKHYQGAVVLVSHDRDFLDQVVTHIGYIEAKSFKLYKGSYSTFEYERAQAIALNNASYKKQQVQIAHMQSYVDRFRYKASKAKQAQSRLKAIEKMQQIKFIYEASPFRFEFKAPQRMPNPMLRCDKASLGYGEVDILTKLKFSIRSGERIGLLGVNGAGKSTLIKGICGQLKPKAGVIEVFSGTKIGYFAQHQVDELDVSVNAITLFRRIAPTVSERELITYLGGFGFNRDDSYRVLSSFSGGEKSRLALALIIWQRPNLLLLDEPTNHLDMDMRQALTQALTNFEGALVVVSHDRYLLKTLVDELYLIKDGQLEVFDGALEDYQAIWKKISNS
ncbi:ATP-binding cassette domain-containing protein [Thiotrichales bacterium 19S3-7]|nr:ATP-binding cassette domain-containing protein [Thiotrichales bacterium 19S3-7]MCF6800558.1 ATP-binding cassette domain-containing protein [Thiotrichales bacterium 19S3-11]